jgi:polysaccharide export outer membrane protein
MRGMLAPIPCLVAPLALAGCTDRVVAVARATAELAAEISARLRRGFIHEPSVAAEIKSCWPFFIRGEVAAPGQCPYVSNMTVESAVAVAGGYPPRARRGRVTLTRSGTSAPARFVVPAGTPLSPGGTVLVGERGF